MAKYTIGGLVAIAVVGAVAFAILAKVNDRNAEAGPATMQTITILDDSVGPTTFEVDAGQPVEVRIVNLTTYSRILQLDDKNVEQLSNIKQPPPGSLPYPLAYLEAPAGKTVSATFRFKSAGEYDMSLGAAQSHLDTTIRAVVK